MPNNLYSPDPREREIAAKAYRTLPTGISIPRRDEAFWQNMSVDGLEWPAYLSEMTISSVWPMHAFGSANASLLIIWHRPGLNKDQYGRECIQPHMPVLGGKGHPHNIYWKQINPNSSWEMLHKYIPQAMRLLGLEDPWSQVMVACLNPASGPTGAIDQKANKFHSQPGGRISYIQSVCKPKVVLLAGAPVLKCERELRSLFLDAVTITANHPVTWDGYGGKGVGGPKVVEDITSAFRT